MTGLLDVAAPPLPGVLFPQLEHRFHLVVMDLPDNAISQCVTKCDFDLLTDSITFDVEQPAVDAGVFSSIRHMCQGAVDIHILLVDGCGSAVSTLSFGDCTVTSHNMSLSYAEVGVATHHITVKFTTFRHIKP